jgi:hypothetical protein
MTFSLVEKLSILIINLHKFGSAVSCGEHQIIEGQWNSKLKFSGSGDGTSRVTVSVSF